MIGQMNIKFKQFLYWVFPFLALVHVFLRILDLPVAVGLSKFFLMPALFIGIWEFKPARVRLVVPLTFAWIGDMAIVFDQIPNQVQALTIGLAAFTVTHGMYAFFSLKMLSQTTKELLKWPFLIAVPFCTGLVSFLLWPFIPHQDESISLLIAFYLLMLFSFLFIQVFVFFSKGANHHVFAGAMLFVLADLTLLFTRFLSDFSADRLLWICLYLPAQWLIVRGFLKFLTYRTKSYQ
jgi:hypothetical protein